jgi:outer membrane lipoprotein-sorting protein
MNEIQQVDYFIEDLLHDNKPRAYRQENVDPEMEKMFESIRAVKRLRKDKTAARRLLSSRWVKGMAAAAMILLVAGLVSFPGQEEVNIVHAVVRAYEELQSYSGVTEIRSERNGEIDLLETIEIQYKKPFKYCARHSYDGSERQYISDGEKLAVIEPDRVTVENIFPEKELWRYHIGTSVRELEYAVEVNTLGTENLFGREATILEYRYAGEEAYNQMWIDIATKLPLRKVLNHPEGSKLVVEFKELEINPRLEDDIFNWTLPEGVKVRELNRAVDIEEVKSAWPETAKLLNVLPEEMELKLCGVLYDDIYEYILRFQGTNESDFLDVYYTTTPGEFNFLPEIELKRLAGGYVDYDANAWNVSKRLEESRIARWVTDEAEVFIVSSLHRDVAELLLILEELAEEKIEDGAPPEENTMELYFMEATETDFKLGKETRAFEKQPGARELMEELLKGPQDVDLSSVIPEGVQLLDLWVENKIAYVDFSAEIARGNYGSSTEGIMLSSIVWTLTQLEEVEAVQILVEGEIVDSIGGHISASLPLTR